MSLEVHLLGFTAFAIGFVAFAYAWSKYVERRERAEERSDTTPASEAEESGGEL